MSPKAADPSLPERIVDAAVHVLADDGRDAVTARRLATEVGASTMAVYTHFGGMDEVERHVMRRGFTTFGTELTRGAVTADPVADWMTQGWGYRRFARREPELYRVMFGDALLAGGLADAADEEACMAAFMALLDRIQACVDSGRWQVDDIPTAGEIVWATSHGHVGIEATGYFTTTGRDPERSWEAAMIRLAVGYGDDPATAQRSAATARRRAARAERADP